MLLIGITGASVSTVAYVAYKYSSYGSYPQLLLKNTIEAILIIGIIYLISAWKSNKVIGSISNNSFGIYLFHSPMIYPVFCYLGNLKPILVVFITFGLLFPLAFVLTNVVRKYSFGRLIIGERK